MKKDHSEKETTETKTTFWDNSEQETLETWQFWNGKAKKDKSEYELPKKENDDLDKSEKDKSTQKKSEREQM